MSEPRYAFPVPPELHDRVVAAIAALREDVDDGKRREAFREAVAELTDYGLQYYFERPMNLSEASGFHAKAARMGLASTRSTIRGLIKRVLKPMKAAQLAAICDFIEGLMVA